MQRKYIVPIVTILVAVSFLTIIVPVNAGAIDSPLISKLHEQYDTRINLYPDFETEEFYASETTFIWHGWGPETELTGRDLAEFYRTASFTLWIEGDPVPLRRCQWRGDGGVYVIFWIVFSADHFEPDTYIFECTWYAVIGGDAITESNTVEITVI